MVKVCIIQYSQETLTETFLRAQRERLPAEVRVIHGFLPHMDDQCLLPKSLVRRASHKLRRMLTSESWDWEITRAFVRGFRIIRPDVVLAQYGTNGVRVMDACKQLKLPLVVHFHGCDISNRDLIDEQMQAYPVLFDRAAAIIAVSRVMERRLIALGAPPDKVHYNPYGVDCTAFEGGDPEEADAVFLAVGRFVEKKAPHLTVLAFAEVHRHFPQAELRMIGEGPLLALCRDLVNGLGISGAVDFLGSQPPEVVRSEMRRARAFVQHSMEAENGDCEGTPVAILEAGATGLPVVSTRHAGIIDVVIEGQTGLLVDERDVAGMAEKMLCLARHPELAGLLGHAARDRVAGHFSIDRSIARLWWILQSSIMGHSDSSRTEAQCEAAGSIDSKRDRVADQRQAALEVGLKLTSDALP
jgi:glycosyltransferase involved in cell wall biosynthesis